MLLSMTGFGEGRANAADFAAAVDVRSVNNRHLKVTVRGADPYPQMEAEFEKLARQTVRRGTLMVRVHVDRAAVATAAKLNVPVLAGYLRQIADACTAAGTPELAASAAAGVLTLPGVAADAPWGNDAVEGEWPLVRDAFAQALGRLDAARKTEGAAMGEELSALRRSFASRLADVKRLLPGVVSSYRERLLDRVRPVVAESGVSLTADQVLREVALFADRTDVTEEVARLAAHLDQFDALLKGSEDGAGRRLEFVVQEMGRETNTLGSKAGDVAISRHVVELKAVLEKMRELIQNVE